jgi:hypothetical protein
MSDETTGDFNSGAAAQQPIESADQSGTPAVQNVPLSALQQERSHRQKVEEELQLVKDHISLLQATQGRSRQPEERSELDSLDDEDVLTVGQFKKLASGFQQQVKGSVEEMRMAQKYPDYQEAVTRYLPEVLKSNPSLAQTLEQTRDYELAYYLATNSDAYRNKTKSTKRNADAERIVANANQSGSLAAVGNNSPVNMVKKYSQMSDDEFMKFAQRNRGYN